MAARDSISAAIKSATASGRPAIVGFLTAGFPEKARFREHLSAVAAGVDVVEIGVPFTDPMADGATIQRASHAALVAGVSLRWILDELRALDAEAKSTAPAHELSQSAAGLRTRSVCRGTRRALALRDSSCRTCRSKRARSCAPRSAREGLALVQMVTPVTPVERSKLLCEASEGFRLRGDDDRHDRQELSPCRTKCSPISIACASVSPIPVCAGFGIRGRDQVMRLKGHVDGVVVGSALVEVLERGEDATAWCLQLKV